MYSTSLVPHITSPTRITSHSITLIDNIFSMDISENAISGNIVSSISDYLPNFYFCQSINLKQIIIRAYINVTLLKVLTNKYSLRIFKTWTGTTYLSLKKKDIDNSFDKFFLMIEMLLDTFAPIQILTKAESRLAN